MRWEEKWWSKWEDEKNYKREIGHGGANTFSIYTKVRPCGILSSRPNVNTDPLLLWEKIMNKNEAEESDLQIRHWKRHFSLGIHGKQWETTPFHLCHPSSRKYVHSRYYNTQCTLLPKSKQRHQLKINDRGNKRGVERTFGVDSGRFAARCHWCAIPWAVWRDVEEILCVNKGKKRGKSGDLKRKGQNNKRDGKRITPSWMLTVTLFPCFPPVR